MTKPQINKEQKEKLLEEAVSASLLSYSPYSKVKVGAALLALDGEVFCGANVENASFSLTVCAERIALYKAVSSGKKEFLAVAVYSDDVLPLPCGACLQALSEFFNGDETLIVSNGKELLEKTFKEFLPYRFSLGAKNGI